MFHTALFIAALIIASASCHAQVYSQQIYSGGRTYEHQWVIGTPPNCYGFTQYREFQDANGMVLMAGEQGRTVRCQTYTRIEFGSHYFTVRVPAWVAAVLVTVALSLLVLLVATAASRIRKHQRHEPKLPGNH